MPRSTKSRPKPNRNTHLFARNKNGTSDRKREGGKSWIRLYDEEISNSSTICARLGCGKEARVGAHICIIDGRNGWHDYIVPFCHGCNRLESDFYLKQWVRALRVH